MSITALHPGLAYGSATAAEDLTAGEFVKLSGADLFSKVIDALDNPFGVVYRDVASGEYVTVYTQGGVYETERFTAGITAGDELEVNPTTALLQKATDGKKIAQAISVTSTELKFKLVI